MTAVEPAPAVAAPHVKIRPPKRWPRLRLGELWVGRDLLFTFGGRDIKLRYRQTVMGALWIVISPLLAAATFAFVFGRVAGLQSEGVSYFLYALVGMLAWTAFSNTVQKMGQALVSNAQMVSKIWFPRLVIPTSVLLGTLLDFAVTLVIVAVVMVLQFPHLHLSMLMMPLWLAGLLCLGAGLGYASCGLMVRYRDVQPVVMLGMQLLLYISPIAYGASAVPRSARVFYDINPLVPLIEGVRAALLHTTGPTMLQGLYGLGAAVVILWAGVTVFRHQERTFADVI